LIGFVTIALTVLGVLLPWIAVLALIVFAIAWPMRRRQRVKPASPAPAPQAAESGATPPPSAPPAE